MQQAASLPVLRQPNAIAQAALAAHARIAPHVLRTPTMHSAWLSSVAPGSRVFIKLESEQHTGSFKVRGALNKILSLPDEQLRRGLVTSSTGNHALAFVHACGMSEAARSAPSTVYLPTTASPAKLARLRQQGAHVVQHGSDCVEAELEARRVAGEAAATYVSPYNDAAVMAGQGTVAVELLQQLGAAGVEPDVVIVPVGGGGLIGGMAATLKAALPHVQVVGAQPAASDVMRQSVAAGRIVDAPSSDTLSDATAGGIEPGAITLQPCVEHVSQWVVLSEQEIADAMHGMLLNHSKLVEGAAGCALAAVRRLAPQLQGLNVAVVACGCNVALPMVQHVLAVGRPWGAGPEPTP